MNFMFDHTTVVAKDDPELEMFEGLANKGLIQLRVLDHVGCEKFAEHVFNYVAPQVSNETAKRVKLASVEVFEHGSNSAVYHNTENV